MSADLVRAYVAAHNRGVRGGDFTELLRMFDDDGQLCFEDAPIGPFVGIEVIREAFTTHPPDDELMLLDVRENVATYGWKCSPHEVAGKLLFEFNGDKIRTLNVTFRA